MQSSNSIFPAQSSQKVIRSLTARLEPTTRESSHLEPRELSRGLGLFDSVMVVVGAMIGSGIFIVPAEMARHIGSAGWLLVAWGVAGILTIAGALCYGELSAMMPQAVCMSIFAKLIPLCGAFSMAGHYSPSSRPGRSPRWRWPLHDFLVCCGR